MKDEGIKIIETNGEKYLDLGDGTYAMIIDEDNIEEYKQENTLH